MNVTEQWRLDYVDEKNNLHTKHYTKENYPTWQEVEEFEVVPFLGEIAMNKDRCIFDYRISSIHKIAVHKKKAKVGLAYRLNRIMKNFTNARLYGPQFPYTENRRTGD